MHLANVFAGLILVSWAVCGAFFFLQIIKSKSHKRSFCLSVSKWVKTLVIMIPSSVLNDLIQCLWKLNNELCVSVFFMERFLAFYFCSDLKENSTCLNAFLCIMLGYLLLIRCWFFMQVSQLGTAAQKYQSATQNSSSNMSVSDLQSNCNM